MWARLAVVGLLLGACKSAAPAPSKAQTTAAPSVAQATNAAPPASEPGARHFGAAFTIAQSEPLGQAAARIAFWRGPDGPRPASQRGPRHAKPEPKDANGAGQGKGQVCGGEKPVDGCAGAVADDGGQNVRVRGTVTSVCLKAGCWLLLEDGATHARIFTREHKFFLPPDVVGKNAEVQGTMRVKTIAPAFAKHLAEDGGNDPARPADAPSQELMMTATGVWISG